MISERWAQKSGGRGRTGRLSFRLCFVVVLMLLSTNFCLSSTLPDSKDRRWIDGSASGPNSPELVSRQDASKSTATSAAPSSTRVSKIFQVSLPVLGPSGILTGNTQSCSFSDACRNASTMAKSSCQVTLMEFSFVNSFGKPFVGDYAPPACIGTANTVIMNFTVASKGVQFDRLAIMYLGDSEVFRTSTAEPKSNGIVWSYIKDMSAYLALWKSPQKVIFDLGNQVTANLTGTYNSSLTATFFNAPQAVKAADTIIPVSARLGVTSSAASVFSVPSSNASNTINFPRNANRAVFSLSSCGQASEEFWWSNVLSSDVSTFTAADGTLFGFSPFREVQVYIDGQLAGVQWPFPVIFTGGVDPGLWSPIVGIDTFDLKEYEIDITPWLPLLCDGKQHTFTMKVAGLNDTGGNSAIIAETVGSSWSVSGNIFVWLDDAGSITTGSALSVSAAEPSITVSQSLSKNSTGANETLTYTTSVQRILSISSTIKTQNGSQTVVWTQKLTHSDLGTWLASGNTQLNNITTTGTDSSQGSVPYSNTYSYPLYANSTAVVTSDGNVTFFATVNRSKNIAISGSSIYPGGLQAFATIPKSANLVSSFSGTNMTTTQNGTAVLFSSPKLNGSTTFGSTSQDFRFGGMSAQGALGMQPDTELFSRKVAAVNGSVVMDEQSVVGEMDPKNRGMFVIGSEMTLQDMSQQVLGRGPWLQRAGTVSDGGVD